MGRQLDVLTRPASRPAWALSCRWHSGFHTQDGISYCPSASGFDGSCELLLVACSWHVESFASGMHSAWIAENALQHAAALRCIQIQQAVVYIKSAWLKDAHCLLMHDCLDLADLPVHIAGYSSRSYFTKKHQKLVSEYSNMTVPMPCHNNRQHGAARGDLRPE